MEGKASRGRFREEREKARARASRGKGFIGMRDPLELEEQGGGGAALRQAGS